MPRVVPSQVVEFIDATFARALDDQGPALTRTGMHLAGKLQGLVALIERIPGELIALSGSDYANFVTSGFVIRQIEKRWVTEPNTELPTVAGKSPIAVIRDGLSKCPDEFPAAATHELSFIGDLDLRTALRLDVGAVDRALANGEWKAATVLAGSVVEALLLWTIQGKGSGAWTAAVAARAQKVPKAKGKDPAEWHLHEYIEIAEELGVISKDTAVQARLAKDFRNLIHPGREQHLRQKCDRATALSAAAAVEHVVRDLSR